jgi:sugar-specific transcriptional regulator TrmB
LRTPDIDESTGRLVELGLTLNEARCYVALLHIAPATAGDIAASSGVPRPKVYGTLKALEQRSFCFSSGEGGVTTFHAVDPKLALEEWTRHREHERRLEHERDRRLHAELLEALPAPRERPAREEVEDIMRLTGAPENTAEALEQLIDRSERRIDIINRVPVLQPESRWNEHEIAALERGVQVRMLFATRELAVEHRYEELVAAGGEVRVARAAPLKLLVRDDGEEALVALSKPDDELPTCVAVQHKDLVAPLQLLFNREWRRASALAAPKRGGASRRKTARSGS